MEPVDNEDIFFLCNERNMFFNISNAYRDTVILMLDQVTLKLLFLVRLARSQYLIMNDTYDI